MQKYLWMKLFDVWDLLQNNPVEGERRGGDKNETGLAMC